MKRRLQSCTAVIVSILLGWLAFKLGRDWFLIYVLGLAPAIIYALDQKQPGARRRT